MKHAHYQKDVSHLQSIDVYRVCQLFDVTDPCIQHAVKKLLCAGQRGAKTEAQDVQEAIDTLTRYQGMQREDSSKPQPATPARAEELQADDGCGCIKCDAQRHHDAKLPFFGGKMTVCAKCGNKRCPKAQDHKFKCSGSNDVGQVGVLEAADDGWIEWGGGDMPVHYRTIIDTRLSDGSVIAGYTAGGFHWNHKGARHITHYRLTKEQS